MGRHAPIGSLYVVMTSDIYENELSRLTAEVNHRANNLLSVIHGIIHLTDASDIETYRSAITGRLESLSLTNSFLASTNWNDVDFGALIERHIATPRISVCGEHLQIKAKSAQSFGMIIHEMTTNAKRHGALQNGGEGRVVLRWVARDGKFIMRWSEKDGPLIRLPQFQNVGWNIIKSSMRGFQGNVEPEWHRTGLECDFICPMEAL